MSAIDARRGEAEQSSVALRPLHCCDLVVLRVSGDPAALQDCKQIINFPTKIANVATRKPKMTPWKVFVTHQLQLPFAAAY